MIDMPGEPESCRSYSSSESYSIASHISMLICPPSSGPETLIICTTQAASDGVTKHKPGKLLASCVRLRSCWCRDYQPPILIDDRNQRADLFTATARSRRLKASRVQRVKYREMNKHAATPGDLGRDLGKTGFAGGTAGKTLRPARRRCCIDRVRREPPMSERRICGVLGKPR